ncbi:response regulator [Caldimonas thermodepolymerans]|jgi:Response regulator containing a CheY-like receiver domain and an HTH DNA-binding domain|uniref:response regulator n=1 Tax=Caldimonas thermodepolymerans TaxID=215580 RepID=UPI000E2A6927|nr:response regulator [Caldimonas thermodepolymerans]QPC31964.1 response regulator [Caldimonas thermodepolymerans]RDI01516.1 response regulator receiver domain-containing protein [Caldimonas thermodepolymerans]
MPAPLLTSDAPLPLQDAPGQPAAPLRVLLVEDSALIRERLLDLVASCEGFAVTAEVESEPQALAALAQQRFDAVVVDLQLREGTGFGVLRALLHAPQRPLTMVLTNTSTRPVRERCLALGAHHFFDKSNEFDQVAQALDALRATLHRGRHP